MKIIDERVSCNCSSLVFSPLLILMLILQGRSVLICIFIFWRKETSRELCRFICSPSLHATYLSSYPVPGDRQVNGRPGRGMHVHIVLYYFGVFVKIENVQTYIKVEKIV